MYRLFVNLPTIFRLRKKKDRDSSDAFGGDTLMLYLNVTQTVYNVAVCRALDKVHCGDAEDANDAGVCLTDKQGSRVIGLASSQRLDVLGMLSFSAREIKAHYRTRPIVNAPIASMICLTHISTQGLAPMPGDVNIINAICQQPFSGATILYFLQRTGRLC
jgi:hypothetical protein